MGILEAEKTLERYHVKKKELMTYNFQWIRLNQDSFRQLYIPDFMDMYTFAGERLKYREMVSILVVWI